MVRGHFAFKQMFSKRNDRYRIASSYVKMYRKIGTRENTRSGINNNHNTTGAGDDTMKNYVGRTNTRSICYLLMVRQKNSLIRRV